MGSACVKKKVVTDDEALAPSKYLKENDENSGN